MKVRLRKPYLSSAEMCEGIDKWEFGNTKTVEVVSGVPKAIVLTEHGQIVAVPLFCVEDTEKVSDEQSMLDETKKKIDANYGGLNAFVSFLSVLLLVLVMALIFGWVYVADRNSYIYDRLDAIEQAGQVQIPMRFKDGVIK